MSKFAIIVIAPDGRTDVLGPYGSEKRAQHDADAIWGDGSEGATSADVYLMDPPANYKEYVVEDMEER